jgi:6-phosphofructokinase 2
MPAIVTITFSPCIDRSATVPELIPEKKLRCGPPKLEPGGGGVNVARAIKKLGGDVVAIYPAGGYTGMHFNKLLAAEGIAVVIIETKNETRENIIILDESQNKQYRFGMPGTAMDKKEWEQLLRAVDSMNDTDFIVASGSLPPGVPDDIFGRIANIAKKKNARLVVDTSGEPLRHAVEEGVYLLKPNLGELARLVNKEHLNEKDIVRYARQVIQRGKAEAIIVSMGAGGALLINASIEKRVSAPPAERKSTVGAGDSMVAGIVLALSQGKSLETATQYGVACGTAATLNPGTELCAKEDSDRFFEQIILRESRAHPS